MSKILISLICLSLASCSGMGLKAHKPNPQSTYEISKNSGVFRIVTIKGISAEMDNVLNGDKLNCNTNTFSIPRGNSVSTFMREVLEAELSAAEKLSNSGSGIVVIVKGLASDASKIEKGTWTLDVDYVVDDKTTNVKSVTEFESKLAALSYCVNTANMFEEAIADNFLEFFKRTR